MHPILVEKLSAALEPDFSRTYTQRDLALPRIQGKAHAIIGMRRAGKTTFLRQLRDDRRRSVPPERAIFLGFDDDRLAGMAADQLALLLEEFYRRFPDTRGTKPCAWFLDEIQLVDGWERFVRRVLDEERLEIVVSGSSARLLSREIHTSLRGRGVETVVRPFSFREFLRHRGEEPSEPTNRLTAPGRSQVEKRFDEYLREGGFPEVQGLDTSLRVELLQGYVDTVLFRDLIERFNITQVAALRWTTRHLLRNPAGAFSVHRLYKDLRSQGHAVAKDTVHALVGHIMDSFLVGTMPLASDSERQKNVNPRKVYPVDPALIRAFDTSGRPNVGHALETVVFVELGRRKAGIGYVRTPGGFEVDFLARYLDGTEELIQVCADPSSPDTLTRELRALDEAGAMHPGAKRLLLLRHYDQMPASPPPDVEICPTYAWLLDRR